VQKVNALDKALRLEHNGKPDSEGAWVQKEISRQDMKDKFDVHFTGIGQCDPGDCDAQKEHFELAPPVNMNDAYKYKYLLDIDGNAFSGRYYAFLLSKSLVYKLAIFREWHDEWLKAWVHYIPLSWKGDEYVESVRYFDQEEVGKGQAKKVADQGREWAGKVLRNEDLEVWYFRLLLE
jgi:Glycosyl transferase family 90